MTTSAPRGTGKTRNEEMETGNGKWKREMGNGNGKREIKWAVTVFISNMYASVDCLNIFLSLLIFYFMALSLSMCSSTEDV